KCLECRKSFTKTTKLLCHRMTHTKGKPFPCATCTKHFAWCCLLVKHQFSHTGEK
ncbi:Zinc finger protein 180, partial [Apaloderma vittatum]